MTGGMVGDFVDRTPPERQALQAAWMDGARVLASKGIRRRAKFLNGAKQGTTLRGLTA